MKGRYIKKSFCTLFLNYLGFSVLVSLIINCIALYAMEYAKNNSFIINNESSISILRSLLPGADEEFNKNKINMAFSCSYPGIYDHGHTGLEETALIIDAETNELIASNDFTLPKNKLLKKYKDNPELYIELLHKGPHSYRDYFRFESYSVSDPFIMCGKNVILINVMRVNYYAYFLKYMLTLDITLLICSTAVSLVLAYKRKTRDHEDDYRRNIINSLSHDLKTPLTIISGCAESLRENIDPSKREFYENTIMENAKYSEAIINNALELSRSEKGVIKPDFSNVEITELIREIWKKYDFTASEKCVSFGITGSKILKCDKRLILQMLENIISNAVKYTSENGTINIMVNSQNITISNTFSGKINTSVKKLTEPFTRGTKERSGKNGSGLGLAIAKNIAAAHKYKLSVDVKDNIFTVIVKY